VGAARAVVVCAARVRPASRGPERPSEVAAKLSDCHRDLIRRVQEHGIYVSSRKGNEDLTGGAARLQVALALGGREIVTPRITPEGDAVGVSLVSALKERAVVMWRMHADVMPDEAAAMTVLALADLHDDAAQAGVPWTLMLDEFGAVIKMAASRAVAILQRGRSHGGQVIVVTQSVADPVRGVSRERAGPRRVRPADDGLTSVLVFGGAALVALVAADRAGVWWGCRVQSDHGDADPGSLDGRGVPPPA
jgi:hypothetical protein